MAVATIAERTLIVPSLFSSDYIRWPKDSNSQHVVEKLARQMLSHRSRLALGLRIDATEWPAESLALADNDRMRTLLVIPLRGNRSHPNSARDHLTLDVPYEHLTAAEQALVVWLLEQMGIKLFAAIASQDVV